MLIQKCSLFVAVFVTTKMRSCLAIEADVLHNLRGQVSSLAPLTSVKEVSSSAALTGQAYINHRMLLSGQVTPITDIIFTGEHECPAGYTKATTTADSLNGDLNQGAGGVDIFFCVSRDPTKMPITGLLFQQSRSCNIDDGWQAVPYQFLNGDLNQGAGGKDIFGCFSTDASTGEPISYMELTETQEMNTEYADMGQGLNGDLNQGTGGTSIFVAIRRANIPITGIIFAVEQGCPDAGYIQASTTSDMLNGDLNQGAGGADIFFCVSRDPTKPPLTGLLFQQSRICDSSDGWQAVPSHDSLNGDLNQSAGGNDIIGCFSTDDKEGNPIIDIKLADFANPNVEHAEMGQDLNGDLNQGAGGASIFVEVYRTILPTTGIAFTGQIGCPAGYNKATTMDSLNGDLNQGAGGADIFLCISHGPTRAPLTGILFQQSPTCDTSGGWQAVPSHHSLNGDLNQGAGGKDIFGCFSTDPNEGTPILDMKLAEAKDANTEYAEVGQGLNGDLNQGAGGKDIFVAIYR